MIGGNVRVNQDAPPYFLYARFDIEPVGLNLVGLKRAGLTREDIGALRSAYRFLYQSSLKLEAALQKVERELDSPYAQHLVQFIRASKRGICRPGVRLDHT
jgi:UDP-N-acetylglucosamine acyltransferase